MAVSGGNAAREETGRDLPGDTAAARGDSLVREVRGAADAAIAHVRKVAATAAAEARLSAASAAAMAAAAITAFALLLVGWICLLALGGWLAIRAGTPVWAALAGALAINLAGLLACRWWVKRLLANLGFARTRGLLRR